MRVGSFRSRENGHLEGEVLEEEGVDLPAEPGEATHAATRRRRRHHGLPS
jgi:hypothetical protein